MQVSLYSLAAFQPTNSSLTGGTGGTLCRPLTCPTDLALPLASCVLSWPAAHAVHCTQATRSLPPCVCRRAVSSFAVGHHHPASGCSGTAAGHSCHKAARISGRAMLTYAPCWRSRRIGGQAGAGLAQTPLLSRLWLWRRAGELLQLGRHLPHPGAPLCRLGQAIARARGRGSACPPANSVADTMTRCPALSAVRHGSELQRVNVWPQNRQLAAADGPTAPQPLARCGGQPIPDTLSLVIPARCAGGDRARGGGRERPV